MSTSELVQCTPPSGENLYCVCLPVLTPVDPADGEKAVKITPAEQTSFFVNPIVGHSVEIGPNILDASDGHPLIYHYLTSVHAEGMKCQDAMAYGTVAEDLRTAREISTKLDEFAEVFISEPDGDTKGYIDQLT